MSKENLKLEPLEVPAPVITAPYKCRCGFCTHPEIPRCPRCGDEVVDNLLVVFYLDLPEHFGVYLCRGCVEAMETDSDFAVPLSSVTQPYEFDRENWGTWKVQP